MLLSPAEMKALEQKAFAAGATPESLMEIAGRGIVDAVEELSPGAKVCYAVFGKGNNGGDALVAARELRKRGWEVFLIPVFPQPTWGELPMRKYSKALMADCTIGTELPQQIHGSAVILDGILGVGARGTLSGPVKSMVQKINALRMFSAVKVFALDLPTGLDGDSGEKDPDCVTADVTLTIGFPKRGLVVDSATNYVGRIAVIEIPGLSPNFKTGRAIVTTPANLRPHFPRRNFDSHKGDFGRVGIIAGSPGYIGAAILTAIGALRGGAGLVSLFVDHRTYEIAAVKAPPEVMVRKIGAFDEILEEKRDVLIVGPGLGRHHDDEVRELVRDCPLPIVLDADGINAISTSPDVLLKAAGPRILTPHPGEMARFGKDFADRPRAEIAAEFVKRFPVTLLFKGARTIIADREHGLSYNSTGSPGMASGGMGDLLSGILGALIAQKIPAYHAARLAAWLTGHAAEIAIAHHGESEETLTAMSVSNTLGLAFKSLRSSASHHE